MKKILRIVLWLLAAVVAVVLIFIGVMWAMEWRPADVEPALTRVAAPSEEIAYGLSGDSEQNVADRSAAQERLADTLRRGDTLRVVSWNIGYAGLGDDMDFFADGGRSTRTTRERTEANLRGIIAFLKEQASDADFILLQEVDFDSHRSYRLHEYDLIAAALPQMRGWWAYNYVSGFVPVPFRAPMGRVEAGQVIFSRLQPAEVLRYQYPGGFPFPVRLFNLKRCMLSAAFPLAGGGTCYVNNTHNSAYDSDGSLRGGEMRFIKDFTARRPQSVTMGDWNSAPPGYTIPEAALNDRFFRLMALSVDDAPGGGRFAFDTATPSVRYGYEPYDPATTTTAVVDFALCGAGIEPLGIETIDLGFRYSDHNPVVFSFVIR